MEPSQSVSKNFLEMFEAAMAEALSIKDISFSYKSWNAKPTDTLFENLSLTLQKGSKTLVLAPFNQGKTTLAKIILRVCPKYFPGSLNGSLTLFGKDLESVEPYQLLQDCTYVSQNPQELFVANSVEQELAFPLESMGLPREEMKIRVDQALQHWGLEQLRSSSTSELSGGERKRVLLAVMEALDTPFWLLDEAFDDLDQQWRQTLKDMIQDTDKTVLVFASRYLEPFESLFDTVLLLENKKIVSYPHDKLLSRFASLCKDDLPNPLDDQAVVPTNRHTLDVRKLHIERKRISTMSGGIFNLSVDDFFLTSGDLVTLVGPNGSGKSSFSRTLCGLDAPVQGMIRINGKNLPAKELSLHVGYLFQSPDLQIFLPTVAEELTWSMRNRNRACASDVQKTVAECAEMFELDLDDTPTTMSYPKRKALQAAVYYLLDRPFYILDELDSALTYHSALSIIARLRRNGAGILLITHDRQFAGKVAQRSYTIIDGRLCSV